MDYKWKHIGLCSVTSHEHPTFVLSVICVVHILHNDMPHQPCPQMNSCVIIPSSGSVLFEEIRKITKLIWLRVAGVKVRFKFWVYKPTQRFASMRISFIDNAIDIGKFHEMQNLIKSGHWYTKPREPLQSDEVGFCVDRFWRALKTSIVNLWEELSQPSVRNCCTYS